MYKRIEPSSDLLALGRLQAGVVSAEQARGLGLPESSLDRLLTEGRWQHLARGLYLVHDQEPTWSTRAWGGVLLGGPQSRLGGLAAGHLHGLNDPPPEIDVLVPASSALTQRAPWRFVRERSGVRSVRSPGEPPRLPIEDAVIDLSERCTEGELVELITKAVQKGRTTAKRLAACAAGRRRLRHRRLLMDLLGDVGEGANSALELRFLRDVERPHGLPRGVRNRRAGHGNYWHDVRYKKYRVLVELDGRLYHDGVDGFRDMYRDNAGVVAGEATMRYGWFDVADRACPMAFQIGHVLIQRGWDDLPRRCDRCLEVPDLDIA